MSKIKKEIRLFAISAAILRIRELIPESHSSTPATYMWDDIEEIAEAVWRDSHICHIDYKAYMKKAITKDKDGNIWFNI